MFRLFRLLPISKQSIVVVVVLNSGGCRTGELRELSDGDADAVPNKHRR